MEDCTRTLTLMTEYLDGILPTMPDWAEKHIVSCPVCLLVFLQKMDEIHDGKLKNRVSGLITCGQAGEEMPTFVDLLVIRGFKNACDSVSNAFLKHLFHCQDCFNMMLFLLEDALKRKK